jgi:hypothetical protein
MNTKEIVEEKINLIWKEYSTKDYCRFNPICVSEIPESGIIFIGLNPSLDKKLKPTKNREVEFYDIDDKHKYFKKFPIISNHKNVNLTWGHLDLLYLRETNQKSIHGILKDKDGVEFIYNQLMVTKEIIDKLLSTKNPVIFIVNNSLAREFLGKDSPHWMNYRFVMDDSLGTYTCLGHPFFFTSMLTGQRALDNGSFERLIWHINFVKQKLVIY